MGIYAITGASSGIGAAIGRQLKAQGLCHQHFQKGRC